MSEQLDAWELREAFRYWKYAASPERIVAALTGPVADGIFADTKVTTPTPRIYIRRGRVIDLSDKQ
jgi:hypothetical protein